MARIDIKSAGGATLATGLLQLSGGVAMSATPTLVTDQTNIASPLRLSTVAVTNYGGGAIASNTAFGLGALTSNTTGADNTAFGNLALNANLTGQWNTAVGHESLSVTTGSNNTALGRHAAKFNTTGSGNTAVGTQAGAVNATGTGNTAVGYIALQKNTNSNNTSIGYRSLNANTSGSQNSVLGVDALLNHISGTGNTAVGYSTGLGITTGDYNTILGANVTGLATGLSNNIILADGQGNQRLNIGSTGNVGIGGVAAPTGRLQVKGSGSTSATTALLVQNNDATHSVVILDNGFLGINTLTPTQRLEVNGTSRFKDTLNIDNNKKINFYYSNNTTSGFNIYQSALNNFHISDGNFGTTILTIPSTATNERIGIGKNLTSVNASSVLELVSTTQGFLPPRMTTAQKVTLAATAVAGLMIYDTNLNKLCVYTGAGWETITSV